jgi:protein tyrosine/serine phosphatase
MTRRVPFSGIQNFRDFGGYKAGDRELKRGVLYRSAQHTFASDEDLAKLREMNLHAIVDLRRPSERERRPSKRWDDFNVTLIEAGDEYESDVRWEEFIHTSDHSADSFRWYLTEFYKSAPLAPRHIELFSRYFDTLSRADGPMLVHCAGGKDRTGMICALTHAFAGVHEDDIFSDFLETNNSVDMDVIGPQWAKDICAECGREPPVENLRVAMSVEPGYLHAAFNVMRASHGSIDGYIEKALGVDDKKRAAIEARILV